MASWVYVNGGNESEETFLDALFYPILFRREDGDVASSEMALLLTTIMEQTCIYSQC